jgi:hypothetical protein
MVLLISLNTSTLVHKNRCDSDDVKRESGRRLLFSGHTSMYTEYPIVCGLVNYRNLNIFPYSNHRIQAMFLLNTAVSCEVIRCHLVARYRRSEGNFFHQLHRHSFTLKD